MLELKGIYPNASSCYRYNNCDLEREVQISYVNH